MAASASARRRQMSATIKLQSASDQRASWHGFRNDSPDGRAHGDGRPDAGTGNDHWQFSAPDRRGLLTAATLLAPFADALRRDRAHQGHRRHRGRARQPARRLRPRGRPQRHRRQPQQLALHQAEPAGDARAARRQHPRREHAHRQRRRGDGHRQPAGLRDPGLAHRRFASPRSATPTACRAARCWSPRCSAPTARSTPSPRAR